jgi:pyruvate dehydrogenase E1 component alpha subunit
LGVSIIEQVDAERYSELGLSQEQVVGLWKKMMLIRRFEEKVEELFLVKKVLKGLSHLYIGEEAIATGLC